MPKFVIDNVAEIFGNMMGIPYSQNARTCSFMKFYILFAKLWMFTFYEKIDIFENFENFRFWNFLKKFWIWRHSKIHNVIWKLSWYDIIIMFYYITSISDINYRLIWGRNMQIYPHVEVGTQKYPLGSKGLNWTELYYNLEIAFVLISKEV